MPNAGVVGRVIDSDGVTPLSAVVVIALENDLFGVTLPIGLAATGVDGTFRINYLPTLSLGEAKPDITLLLFPPGSAPVRTRQYRDVAADILDVGDLRLVQGAVVIKGRILDPDGGGVPGLIAQLRERGRRAGHHQGGASPMTRVLLRSCLFPKSGRVLIFETILSASSME